MIKMYKIYEDQEVRTLTICITVNGCKICFNETMKSKDFDLMASMIDLRKTIQVKNRELSH